MILIAHRGNINGITENENHPNYIQTALNLGFDVECDLWVKNGYLFLGHDNPDHETNLSFLLDNHAKLWIHLKNIEAYEIVRNYNLNYFSHESDSYVITSKGFSWIFPNKPYTKNSVIVCFDDSFKGDCYAVCTDYPQKYCK